MFEFFFTFNHRHVLGSGCSLTTIKTLPHNIDTVLVQNRMALITLSGYPSSGKTKRALQLKIFLEERLRDPTYDGPTLKVEIVSDIDVNVEKKVYSGVFLLDAVESSC